ncbi:MAG TPA: carboxypeptidase-like regulatory domain-containing protein [Thermoanaerobaculia bacterium]|nr:carboxypeptidase-like regulatory domain-containing protein [Thermoanaerobaculia bacterium]
MVLFLLLPLAANAETITGTVRDGQSGTSLKSMVVAAYNAAGSLQANATTDVNGRYDVTVPAGSYRVLAYDPAGVYATQFNNDAPSFEESPPTPVSGSAPVTVNFALHRGGNVTGGVTTSGGLRPAFTVAAYNLSGTRRGFTTTNASGSYSIVLPPGTYKIVTYDDAGSFAPAFFRDKLTFADAEIVTVAAGQTVPSVDFFLQLGARLAGTVTDNTGAPVANAVIIGYSTAGFQITFAIAASDGRFFMTVPPGTYRFVAIDPAYKFAAGYLNAASSFDSSPAFNLAGGQVRTDLNFRLEPGGRVAGRVIDAASGSGLRNMTIAAYNNDGSLRTFVNSDGNGDFVLLLPGGDFRIAAYDTTLVYATEFYSQSKSFAAATAVATSVGQTVTLQPFTLSHGGRLTGAAVDQSTGARISGIAIAAYDGNGFLVGTSLTFSTGTYRLVLPAGAYRVVAYDPQLRYASAFAGSAANFDLISPLNIAVDADTTLNFTLQRGTLVTGTVVEESHEPVPDIEIYALDLNQNRVTSAITGSDGSFRLSLIPGSYKFMAVDPNGRYGTSYMGGSTFSSAVTIIVDAAGAPKLTMTVQPPARRRAVRH